MVHGLETMEKQNAVACEQPRIKKAVVVNCEYHADQALYVGGKLICNDSTIYAHDIVTGVGGPSIPFTLEQIEIESYDEDWPEELEDLPPATL
jgi:hypothetical protein